MAEEDRMDIDGMWESTTNNPVNELITNMKTRFWINQRNNEIKQTQIRSKKMDSSCLLVMGYVLFHLVSYSI